MTLRNGMKKYLLLIAFVFLIGFPFVVHAGIIDPFNKGDMTSPIQSAGGALGVVVVAIQWMYTIFFIVAVFFILMAAYNFVLGGANEKKVAAAKGQLKYAAIAIVVALLASGMSLVISNFLQNPASAGSQPTTTTPPTTTL